MLASLNRALKSRWSDRQGYLGVGFDDGETPRPVRLFSVGPEEVGIVLLRSRRGIGRRSGLFGGR